MATVSGPDSVASRYDIVPTSLAVAAMRDSGYKNAATALAELVDNSVQAKATSIKLMCSEVEGLVTQRSRRRLSEIAVLDNGLGMSADVLRVALQYGNGTRLGDRDGIGRFGMGLPNASLSQCKRVDVWSWQEGGSTLHTFLDFEQIRSGAMNEIPQPTPGEVPEKWRLAGGPLGRSGTLVVWSSLDRLTWVTAKAVFDNSNLLIGRIYRRFIHRGDIRIEFLGFLENRPEDPHIKREAQINDPMYLMAPSSTPAPFSDAPMFEEWPDTKAFEHEVLFEVVNHGRPETHKVTVRFSLARLEARDGSRNSGSTASGQHAARNVGVSLMRADRELDLDLTLVSRSDPRERWWGIEVDFPPALDEVFGVTNNKQQARNFSTAMTMDWKDFEETDGQNVRVIKETLKAEGDPLYSMLLLKDTIEHNLSAMRTKLQVQTRGTDAVRRRHAGDEAEVAGTKAVIQRGEEGHEGKTDQQVSSPTSEREQQIEALLVSQGQAPETAKALAHRVVDEGLRLQFSHAELDTQAFFSVRSMGGVIMVALNVKHPVYKHLLETLPADDQVSGDADDLRVRLNTAAQGLKLLLGAWARYEDELSGPALDRAQQARSDWGSMAREFFDAE